MKHVSTLNAEYCNEANDNTLRSMRSLVTNLCIPKTTRRHFDFGKTECGILAEMADESENDIEGDVMANLWKRWGSQET